MNITIRKIAKDLRIAVSTVSKAFNDSHEISEETKQKILEYAASVNYIPNPYAGSLKNRKTKNIAVVLPEVADSFFSNSINGIESVAVTKGYHVMVYLTHENPARENSILRELRSGRADGILISVSTGIAMDSAMHAEVSKHIPLIFFDRVCEGIDSTKVITDDFESSYNAVRHLILKGSRNIAFLAFAEEASIIRQRLAGFRKALLDFGIGSDENNVVKCSQNDAENFILLKNFFSCNNKVDGVIASVEKLAMQSYSVCRDLNIVIPDKLRVVAFSNLLTAALLNPPLTTVTQPAFEMGRTAANLLFGILENKKHKVESIVLPSVLYERDSTS
jgi:LacI family transcriptional regulator